MNQGQFNVITEQLERIIELLEAQRAATIAKAEIASDYVAAQFAVGEEKPKPAPKGKKS